EVSGHMFFAENYYGVDDGILASCKIIETAARSPEPISRLFDSVPHLHATPELKAPCPDGEKFRVIEELTRELKTRYETIDTDGARVLFPGGAWGLVRASNTNPYLTLRFEARTDAEIEAMKRVIYGALRPPSQASPRGSVAPAKPALELRATAVVSDRRRRGAATGPCARRERVSLSPGASRARPARPRAGRVSASRGSGGPRRARPG